MVAPTIFVCTFAVYEAGNRLFSGRQGAVPYKLVRCFCVCVLAGCAVVCGCLRTTDGRPYGANVVSRSVAKLTSVRIQGVDAFGVSEIDLKHVPNR